MEDDDHVRGYTVCLFSRAVKLKNEDTPIFFNLHTAATE